MLWPASNSIDIPPAFFEESPDPLPGYGVSGYPVSVQFNPSVFVGEIPVISRFELIDEETGQVLEIIKRIDKASDQYKKFSAYEHAIFPVKRLQWAKQYRAEVDYSVGDDTRTISWVFNTRELNVPTYELSVENDVIKEESGNSFAVYLPPQHNHDAVMAYSTKCSGLTSLNIQTVDGNTLLINGVGSGDIELTFHGVLLKIAIE